jgi:hypothetical protein
MTERLTNKYGDAIDFKKTESEFCFEILGYDNKFAIDKDSKYLKEFIKKLNEIVNRENK